MTLSNLGNHQLKKSKNVDTIFIFFTQWLVPISAMRKMHFQIMILFLHWALSKKN